MQCQTQTWKHFTRKLNIDYEKKIYELLFFGFRKSCSPKAWGFDFPLLFNP